MKIFHCNTNECNKFYQSKRSLDRHKEQKHGVNRCGRVLLSDEQRMENRRLSLRKYNSKKAIKMKKAQKEWNEWIALREKQRTQWKGFDVDKALRDHDSDDSADDYYEIE